MSSPYRVWAKGPDGCRADRSHEKFSKVPRLAEERGMRTIDRQRLDAEASGRLVGDPAWLCSVLQALDEAPRQVGRPEPRHRNRLDDGTDLLGCEALECPPRVR